MPVWIAPATRVELSRLESVPFYRRFVWSDPLPVRADAGRFATDAVPLPEGLEVIHAPGHSDDHHVVWDNATGTLFGGDLFLGVKVRVAHHSERPRTLVATLRRIAALEPARLFDAHRGDIRTPTAALRAKADWLDETIDAIQVRANAGMPAHRIRTEVLGREPGEYYVSFNEYSKLQLVQAVLRGD